MTVVDFPSKLKKKPLNVAELTTIGFLTVDDRDLWIQDKADMLKIMRFIISEKITIFEDK